jgi:hypothetical protein
MQFTVGLRLKEKTDRVLMSAEDALTAALKVKEEYPDAIIIYVRPQNLCPPTKSAGRRTSPIACACR